MLTINQIVACAQLKKIIPMSGLSPWGSKEFCQVLFPPASFGFIAWWRINPASDACFITKSGEFLAISFVSVYWPSPLTDSNIRQGLENDLSNHLSIRLGSIKDAITWIETSHCGGNTSRYNYMRGLVPVSLRPINRLYTPTTKNIVAQARKKGLMVRTANQQSQGVTTTRIISLD